MSVRYMLLLISAQQHLSAVCR